MFRQEICRNSLIFVAPGNFGTKTRIVELAVAGRKFVAKKFLIEANTSTPMKSQEALKNAEVSPSGHGALLGFCLKKVDLISSSVGWSTSVGVDVQGKRSL